MLNSLPEQGKIKQMGKVEKKVLKESVDKSLNNGLGINSRYNLRSRGERS